MSRSKWKGPYLGKTSEKNSSKVIQNLLNLEISRDTTIFPQFVGKTFLIHNGKKFNDIFVNEDMIGHKFGEFSITRKPFLFKKKKKK